MDGEKKKIDDILNKNIVVLKYRISESKYTEKCLTLQFELDGARCVLFTGSGVLMNQCERYEKMLPFEAKIRKIDKYYTFS